MAEKMETEQAPYGEEQKLQVAEEQTRQSAQAEATEQAQFVNQAIQGNPEAATAIEQGSKEAQTEGNAPVPSFMQERPAPTFTGILQAPSAMQQPMRTPFERDQAVAMMWDVVAKSKGTALTQMVANELTGVD